MICSAYFGKLSDKRKTIWNSDDTNPYEVLDLPIRLERKGHVLLESGSRYFREEISIDWGSYAWKCTKEEILCFLNDSRSTLPWLIENENELIGKVEEYIVKYANEEFGVVFIEES